jgi:hypothetical protein
MATRSVDPYQEYTFFIESTQWLTERRQTANDVYTSVNMAVFAALSFVFEDMTRLSMKTCAFMSPLLIAGVLVCFMWHRLIVKYKQLINWRFDQLMAMERNMPDSYRMYNREWEDIYSKARGGFSGVELWLPRIFIALYAAIWIGITSIAAQ